MVRMPAASNINKWYRFIARLLQFATGKHPRGITVKQQSHHQLRWIRRRTAATIDLLDSLKSNCSTTSTTNRASLPSATTGGWSSLNPPSNDVGSSIGQFLSIE